MKRKISIVRYVLLVLSLGMVAGSMVLHRGPSPLLSAGDPTQLTHPELAAHASEIPVQINTPAGTSWKYVDFSQGKGLAEFLNEMGQQLFGKEAYAMSAPQMRERQIASAAVGVQVGFNRGMSEAAARPVTANVHIVARHADGTIYNDQWVHNLRTNAGITWQEGQMAGTPGNAAGYIAVSANTTPPSVGDTSLSGEISSGGLARAAASISYTATASDVGSGTYTSGGTITGSSGQTCTLSSFNNGGSNATATVALTGANTIASGTALTITAVGSGFTSAPTSATLGSGTATCSGTATVSMVLGIPATFTASHTFTASATQTGVDEAGFLTASSGGTLAFENTFSAVSMNSGDTLAVTWSFNFSVLRSGLRTLRFLLQLRGISF
jgi:hypothetical protein